MKLIPTPRPLKLGRDVGCEGVDGIVSIELGFFKRQQVLLLLEDLDATPKRNAGGKAGRRDKDMVELLHQESP